MKFKLTKKQKQLIFSLLIVVIAGFFGLDAYYPENAVTKNLPMPTPGQFEVAKVYDGDTIGVQINTKIEKVRLIGVDTPETHHPKKPVQCFGQAASDYTTKNLLGKKVRLESDPIGDNIDRYSRLLRYVYLEDGTLWNQKLVADGYGFAYTSFPFGKSDEFRQAEKSARENNRGLWGGCEITTDNGFISSGVAQ
jgi:micrococcal nuclease